MNEHVKRRFSECDEACSALEILIAWKNEHEKQHDTYANERRQDLLGLSEGLAKLRTENSAVHMDLVVNHARLDEKVKIYLSVGIALVMFVSGIIGPLVTILFSKLAAKWHP